jgi:sugar lactone lactonase YvrE
MTQATVLFEGLNFGEGPRWHDGRLWLSDMYRPAVLAVSLDGGVEHIVDVPGRPSGLGWLPDGRLLVVSMLDRRLLRLDPGGLVTHADLSAVADVQVNDMAVDRHGRAYAGGVSFEFEAYTAEHGPAALFAEPGPPTAALVRVDPDGTVQVAASDLKAPNGAVITPDGRTLIVAESLGLRLTAFDMAEDGTLSNRRVWAPTFPAIPDGICLDAEGAVWVANLLAPECLRIAEGGEVLARVTTSQPCFACALGGPDRSTLFLMTAPGTSIQERTATRLGRIETARVDVPGAGWP